MIDCNSFGTFLIEYKEPEVDFEEFARYAGIKGEHINEGIESLMKDAMKEAKEFLSYKICYRVLNMKENDGKLVYELRKLDYFEETQKIIIFGATLGMGIDRLINKYSKTQLSKALILQALGTERIESLCNLFEEDVRNSFAYGVKKRVSPGYGKFKIELQNDIFNLLNLPKKIGISLNESLIMSPSKSVTAVIPLGCESEQKMSGCSECNKLDCAFRRI